MALSNIAGQEPSTVTFRVATVTHDRGSTTEHQEILTLGGQESSLAIAAVVNATPASTVWALAVREVAHSTTVQVSSVAGAVIMRSSAADAAVRVYQSTAADLNVTVAGYVAPSTIVTVSTGSVRVHQSSAADLNVTVAGYSTTVQVSSLGGVVAVSPASSGATGFYPVRLSDGSTFITDSTQRALRVTSVDVGGSTQVSISSASGRFAVSGYHSTGIVDVTDSTNLAFRVNVVAGSAAGSTIYTMSAVQSTSGDAVIIGDTSNQAIRVNVVAGAAGGSTIVTVSTGSVRVHQSTAADLNVTVAGYSTVMSVSTGSVRVHQSTAADLNVTVAGYSTVMSVSTGSVRVHQSSAADLNVTVAGYVAPSTTVQVSSLAGAVTARNYTSSGGAVEGSTRTAASDAIGLHVRPVLPSLTSTSILVLIQTAGGSTVLVSSVANQSVRVFGMSVMSTVVAFSSCAFLSSGAKERWGLLVGSGSSGITGANLAVSPPGWLFQTDAGEALNFSASSSGLYRVSVASWQE